MIAHHNFIYNKLKLEITQMPNKKVYLNNLMYVVPMGEKYIAIKMVFSAFLATWRNPHDQGQGKMKVES